MTNKEKLIQSLLAGLDVGHSDTRSAALIAIGNSGLIDDDRLINALREGVEVGNHSVKQAAYRGMGLMLRNSNRQ